MASPTDSPVASASQWAGGPVPLPLVLVGVGGPPGGQRLARRTQPLTPGKDGHQLGGIRPGVPAGLEDATNEAMTSNAWLTAVVVGCSVANAMITG